MNLTPEYKKYIEDSRAKGMTDIQIRGALMAAGWTDIQVRDLFDVFKRAEQPAQTIQSAPTTQVVQPTQSATQSVQSKSYDFSMPIASATVATQPSTSPTVATATVNPMPAAEQPMRQSVQQSIAVTPASRIAPQVEPQPLRPYIAQPTYTPPQQQVRQQAPFAVGAQPFSSPQSIPTESRGYVSSEFKPEPVVATAAPTNASSATPSNGGGGGIASYQGGASFTRPVVEQSLPTQQNPVSNFYPPQSQESIRSPYAVAGAQAQVKTSSPFKKVFFTVLALAFFVSSSVYAYMQFVDPFLLKTDEQVLMESLSHMASYQNQLRIENNAVVVSDGATVTASANIEYGGENYPNRWSLHLYDVTADGPNEAFEQAMIDGDLKSILTTLDFKVRYIDGEVYLYPGGLAAFFGPDAQEALFEKWIQFTSEEIGGAVVGATTGGTAKVEFNNIFSEVPSTIQNINYTITDSYVKDLQQYVALSITQEALAEYLKTTLEQDVPLDEVPSLEMVFVINKDKWLAGIETKATLDQDSVSLTSVIIPAEAGATILPPSEHVPAEEIMGVIFGGLMATGADVPQGPLENALSAMRAQVEAQYTSSYVKLCTASNKINAEGSMKERINTITDIQGMKTKGDQASMSCYSSADAYVIGATVSGKTACLDSQGKIGSDDKYVINTDTKECVAPKTE